MLSNERLPEVNKIPSVCAFLFDQDFKQVKKLEFNDDIKRHGKTNNGFNCNGKFKTVISDTNVIYLIYSDQNQRHDPVKIFPKTKLL